MIPDITQVKRSAAYSFSSNRLLLQFKLPGVKAQGKSANSGGTEGFFFY